MIDRGFAYAGMQLLVNLYEYTDNVLELNNSLPIARAIIIFQ